MRSGEPHPAPPPSSGQPDEESPGRAGVVVGLLVISAALGFALAARLIAGGGDETASAPLRTLTVSAAAAVGGDGSTGRPFREIQAALDEAQPGETVVVGPGVYSGELRSVRSGRADAPIRLLGEGARIVGDDSNHLIEIDHDDIEVSGFELTGDADVLVWVQGARRVRVLDNYLHDAGGECVRIKYLASEVEVGRNRISGCGQNNFDLADDDKNGEGVYIGTAPEQLDENPTGQPDTSSRNWVHDNQIVVPAECVDVKEHAEGNLIENNTCTGGRDDNGAGYASRGEGSVIRGNRAFANVGSGVRLGGDESTDGVRSTVRDNELHNNRGFGVEVNALPQVLICGNRISGSGEGVTNVDSVDPSVPCPG